MACIYGLKTPTVNPPSNIIMFYPPISTHFHPSNAKPLLILQPLPLLRLHLTGCQILLTRLLRPLLRHLGRRLAALHHGLHLAMDVAEIAEHLEREAFALAIRDEVVSNLGEQEVGLAGRGKIGYAVAAVEEGGTLGGRELGVRADGEGFVVSKVAVDNKSVPGP